MFFLFKLLVCGFITFGLFSLYTGIFKETTKVTKKRKILLGFVIIIVGIVIFPKESNSYLDAENWIHTEFRDTYWQSIRTIEKTDAIVSDNLFYVNASNSETRQAYKDMKKSFKQEYVEKNDSVVKGEFKKVSRQIKEAKKLINESKSPWYLDHSLYKKGNKILNLQNKQLDLQLQMTKGYQTKGTKFFGKAFNIRREIEDIDSEIDKLLDEGNLLPY